MKRAAGLLMEHCCGEFSVFIASDMGIGKGKGPGVVVRILSDRLQPQQDPL